MAEPLKNYYGPEIPKKIAKQILRVHSLFPAQDFLKEALAGYDDLELLERGRHIARALKQHLPHDFPQTAKILVASMGPKFDETENFGMAPFLYMPHVFFIAENGLKFLDESLDAYYEITQRFTAEFGIRPFLIQYPEKTLARLKNWAKDPSPHVRRLVSEGTRPRLPWAMRLPAFQKDPQPVLNLLELLKDDPELYVRRSVANNLNDIGKDNPAMLYKTARAWMKKPSPERDWLIRHALRSAVKKGEPEALKILGYKPAARAAIKQQHVSKLNGKNKNVVEIQFTLINKEQEKGRYLVDFQIHYVKSNGRTAPKVFKLKTVELAPEESVRFVKKVSLHEMTTRKHYPGRHKVEALINGTIFPVGEFVLGGTR